MLNRLAGLSLLLGLLGPASAQDEPFAFRGYKLGITIDEFRRAPHPDKAQSWMAKTSPKVLCTGESIPKGRYEPFGLYLPESRKKAGVVRCTHVDWNTTLQEFNVTIGGYGQSAFQFFRNSPSEPYRLFSIVIRLPEKMFKEVADAYLDKLGKPEMDKVSEIQNRFGAKFENRNLIWSNAVSDLYLEQRSGQIDSTVVVFTLKSLADAADAAEKKTKGLKDQL